MERSNEYLNAALEKLALGSDARAAKEMGILKSSLSEYRSGKRIMDDFTAAKVAKILEIHPFEIIAMCNEEREKTEERRAFWRGFRSEVAGIRTQIGHATIKAMIVTALATSFLIGAASVVANIMLTAPCRTQTIRIRIEW